MSSSPAPSQKPAPGGQAQPPTPPAGQPPKPPTPPSPPQPPDQWKSIAEKLKDLNPSYEPSKGYLDFVVRPEQMVEAARRLKDMGFDHVISVGVVDYPAKKQFKVMYHVTSYLNEELSKLVVSLSTYVSRDNPRLPSLTGVWLSAEFQEREEYEMLGVVFEGHPDLRPLLLTPVVAALRPLRKDFVVEEESDDIETDYEAFVATKWW